MFRAVVASWNLVTAAPYSSEAPERVGDADVGVGVASLAHVRAGLGQIVVGGCLGRGGFGGQAIERGRDAIQSGASGSGAFGNQNPERTVGVDDGFDVVLDIGQKCRGVVMDCLHICAVGPKIGECSPGVVEQICPVAEAFGRATAKTGARRQVDEQGDKGRRQVPGYVDAFADCGDVNLAGDLLDLGKGLDLGIECCKIPLRRRLVPSRVFKCVDEAGHIFGRGRKEEREQRIVLDELVRGIENAQFAAQLVSDPADFVGGGACDRGQLASDVRPGIEGKDFGRVAEFLGRGGEFGIRLDEVVGFIRQFGLGGSQIRFQPLDQLFQLGAQVDVDVDGAHGVKDMGIAQDVGGLGGGKAEGAGLNLAQLLDRILGAVACAFDVDIERADL